MRFLAVLVLVIGIADPAFAIDLPINPVIHTCKTDLRAGDPAFRLAIGVLAEAEDGSLVLGVSPYAGSVHNAIVESLVKNLQVKRILWLGEIRHLIDNGKPIISEANETSGYYAVIKDLGIEVGDRTIQALNSYLSLPLANRTIDFTGHIFEERNKRLAKELQDIQGDVRHTIGNSLQVISSITQLLKGGRGADAKEEMLKSFVKVHSSDLTLTRWLILNLYEEQRLEDAEFEMMSALLNSYSRPTPSVSDIEKTDLEQLDLVMGKISQMINPNLGGMRVDLYKLR